MRNDSTVAMPTSPMVHGRAEEIRITSYNVCYTKLLRVAAGRKPWWMTSTMKPQSHAGAEPLPYAWEAGNQPRRDAKIAITIRPIQKYGTVEKKVAMRNNFV